MLILKSQNNQSALTRVVIDSKTAQWTSVPVHKSEPWSVKARNKEQEFSLNLLTNPAVHLVSMVGRAGCGKSFLALAAGVEQVIEKKNYDTLIVIRPTISVGEELGYLPGSVEEKLEPWLQPIKDNLNVLFSKKKDNVDLFFEQGIFQMEALSYIRGRSIPRAYIIVDECQNLSLSELKTVLTRAADGTKIVLTGDIEQIDKSKLDVVNNGLSITVEKLKGYTISGHMTLTKGQRSPLATVCADIL
jgi:PhoH-like ATPase